MRSVSSVWAPLVGSFDTALAVVGGEGRSWEEQCLRGEVELGAENHSLTS